MAIPGFLLSQSGVNPQVQQPYNPNSVLGLSNTTQAPQQAQYDVPGLYNGYINQYADTNPTTANMLRTSYNDYGDFTNSANNINNLYNNMYTQTDPYYNNYNRINQGLDSDVVGKLQGQLQTAYSQYGPDGSQTKLVQDYHTRMANNIAAQNARDIGKSSALARASGANAGAQQEAVTQATLNANSQYAQLKQTEIQQLDSVYQNLNQYIDNFVKTYTNSKDKYVRDTYNQLLQYKAGIESARTNSLVSLEGSRLQDTLRQRAASTAAAPQLIDAGIDKKTGRKVLLNTATGQLQYAESPIADFISKQTGIS